MGMISMTVVHVKQKEDRYEKEFGESYHKSNKRSYVCCSFNLVTADLCWSGCD